MIIINPKAGVYPFQVKMKINPTLTQASIGKGFQIGQKGGNLSVDFDYAKSLSDERRPYQGFQRFTSNILYSKTIGENLFTTTGFGFYSDLDATKLDPSDAQYQRERRAENLGFKFNTNIVWNQTSDFFKFIKLNVSVNYARQKGYNQEIKGNFGYMVTSAMQDGTITSNRKEDIFDSTGQQITNASKLDPTALTNILPYEFLTQMSTYGNPLNVFTKLSANFFKEISGVKNRIVAGIDWKTDVNFGKGKVFDPLMPPSSGLRMRPYSDIPALNQLSAYAEDNITTEIANREFMLQLGVRADAIQPGRKENRTVISPRFNVSYEVIPKIMTLKGGWGITAKAPPLMFLYPDKAYFDYVNYDNLGATGVMDDQKLSIITTKVYDTVSQKLKIAKNTKSEIGADFRFGQTSLSVTGYNEILKNGYTFGRNFDTFHQFELVKYKTLNNRPGTYPELAVDKTLMSF
ncbi:TonB-dependent receptor [Bacteroides faecichinchillae]|uniref:TonB-dependent receptor n=1 Tax=Bacteroides faecichinchillae TaxID=871325 RepID=UPI0004696431|nr:TonB-dependent receptor [Bacteroides faecichinchillae]